MAGRAKGSKRVKPYKVPMPLEWQEVTGGYQKYKLPTNAMPVLTPRATLFRRNRTAPASGNLPPPQLTAIKDRFVSALRLASRAIFP